MKQFIIKIILFSLAAFGCFYASCVGIKCLGLSDWAYKRFTVDRQQSLIVGTSRSAQGIQPGIINAMTGNDYADVYNFSFTVTDSPYGELYYQVIKDMINDVRGGKDRLYVVSVDPWGLSDEKTWDAGRHREHAGCLGGVRVFHQNPNPLYLARHFRLSSREWLNSMDELQDDGLYRIDFDMAHADTATNIRQKLDIYRGYVMTRSEYREKWLRRTIGLLKQTGDVYMCRVPVHKGMLAIENENWPAFDSDMERIAADCAVPYFSFASRCGCYRTTDGNHLYKEDAALFTKHLCDSIRCHRIGRLK